MSDSILILDCGASHVGAAVVSINRRRCLRLEQIHLLESNPRTDADACGGASSRELWLQLVKRIGRIGSAVVALPSPTIALKCWETADLGLSDQRKAIRFEASQALPGGLSELVWDVNARRCGPKSLHVTLASIARSEVEALCSTFDGLGLRLQRIVPVAWALEQRLRSTDDQPGNATVVIEIGAKTCHVSYSHRGRCQFRTLTVGGSTVTRVLAEDRGMSFEDAERLKRLLASGVLGDGGADSNSARMHSPTTGDAGPPLASVSGEQAFRRAYDQFLGRLQLEITRTLVNQRIPGEAPPPTRVILTGGGALLPDLASALAERLKLSVDLWDPFASVDVAPDCNPNETGIRFRSAGLLATAAVHLLAKDADFDLLPLHRKRELRMRKRQPVFLGAATLAALSLVPPLTYYQKARAAAEGKTRELELTVEELNGLQRRNLENLSRIADAHEQIVLMRRIAASRGNWLRFFSELQSKLCEVEDVWLDRVQYVKPPLASSPVSPARFVVTGRLLESDATGVEGTPTAEVRVRDLLAKIGQSPFVFAVEHERFDRAQAGVLGFEVTLRMNQSETL